MDTKTTQETAKLGALRSGDLFGKCPACGTKLVLSSGWVPSYNDPDNASGSTEAEPVCPSCEWSARFNALPEGIRTIGVAMELKTRIQQLAMGKGRLKARYLMAVADVDAHMKNCERSLAALSLPNAASEPHRGDNQ